MADFERILEGPEPEDVVYEGYKTVILAKENESALVSFISSCCKQVFSSWIAY